MEELSKESQSMDAAIDHARKGDLEFFKDAPPDILMKARDSNGDTVLSIVVNGNHVDCCEEICKRCPSLLCSQHYQGGDTPLHNAAYSGYFDILKILISTCDKADLENQHDIKHQGGDRADRQKTLTLRTTTIHGYNAMHKAVNGGKLESIKLLIEADPNNELLRAGDNQNNTPLHLAVESNQLEIARWLIKVDSDFPYGANSGGKTPLLIAIDKAESQNDREMLKLILELQPTQSMVKVNENGWTALHYSVSKENLYSIGSIIQSCPQSSEEADKEGQNFFHHAVKSRNEKMVKQILGMKEITSTVLNGPDHSGRTPWDVATGMLIASNKKGIGLRNRIMVLCLHEDARVTKDYDWFVKNHYIFMMKQFMKTNADFLINTEKEVFLESKNEEGDTILLKAAQERDSADLCKMLCERCHDLIYHQSKGGGGGTALHHAAWRGELSILQVLIEVGSFDRNRRETAKNFLVTDEKDLQGDTALHKAVLNHKLEAVKLLVEADPDYEYGANTSGETPIMISIKEARSKEIHFYEKENSVKIRQLLFEMQPIHTMARIMENSWTLFHLATSDEDLSCIEDIIKFCSGYLDVVDNDGKNFLHIAAESKKIEVVRLVLRAKDIPDAVFYNQDKEGNTPMHIAADTKDKSLMECFLFDHRFSKIMPRGTENGWTKLHQAASDGDIGIIKDIIKWTNYLDGVDSEGKNFLHIAAEFEKIEVVKIILRVKDIPKKDVLDKKDNNGNTPFHIAALTGNEPLTRCFLFHPRINKDTMNNQDQKPLDVIKFSYDKRKAKVDRIAHTVDQSELKDQSDFDLVVGALIATVSFAAGITVPGGYINGGPNQGTAVFSKRVSFASFTISNTFALVFSLFAVFSHFCARRLSADADIICLLNVAKLCTLAAMYCMMAAFIAGSFTILAKSNLLAIVVCVISCLFFFLGCGPMWMIVKQSKWAAPASEHKQDNTNDEQPMAVRDVEAVGVEVVTTI